MGTLCLDTELEGRASHELHTWLGGDWALLFSHPEDFAVQGRGRKRWLARLRGHLDVDSVRLITVKRDNKSLANGWIEELAAPSPAGAEPQLIRVREPSFAAADALSFAARSLRGVLLAAPSRFVLIIDGELKRQKMLRYGDRSRLSVLDLLAWTDARRCCSSIATRAEALGRAHGITYPRGFGRDATSC
jgi:alkyl hydroperoxide reductase subunit AhpC